MVNYSCFLYDNVEQDTEDGEEGEAELGDLQLAEKTIAFSSEVDLVNFVPAKAFHDIFIANILVHDDLRLIAFSLLIFDVFSFLKFSFECVLYRLKLRYQLDIGLPILNFVLLRL